MPILQVDTPLIQMTPYEFDSLGAELERLNRRYEEEKARRTQPNTELVAVRGFYRYNADGSTDLLGFPTTAKAYEAQRAMGASEEDLYRVFTWFAVKKLPDENIVETVSPPTVGPPRIDPR